MDDYKFLIKTIMKDVSNKNDRKFILKNLPELSNELYDFSSYIALQEIKS